MPTTPPKEPAKPDTKGASLLSLMSASDPAVLRAIEQAFGANRHYAAIGRVAANWSYLEAVIDDWCLRVAKIPVRLGVCLTAQISGSARKLDAFIAVAELQGAKPKTLKKLHKIASKTAGLAERRHRVVHDVWDILDPEHPHRLEATARKKLRLQPIMVLTKDVLKLAAEVDLNRADFEELAAAVWDETST